MRILLVEPPFHAFMHYDRWFYPTSLTLLAAILQKHNCEVQVYDADRYFFKDPQTKDRNYLIKKQELYFNNAENFNHEIYQHFIKVLNDYKPHVVGCSIFTCKLKTSMNILKLTKEIDPNIKTCVGGAHVTAIPESLNQKKYIDAVFCGYSDVTFPKWIDQGLPSGVFKANNDLIDIQNLPLCE